MISQFKYFLSGINLLISKSFFYTQSKFTDILKDILFSFRKRRFFIMPMEFITVSGTSKIEPPNFDYEIASSRGNSKSSSSYSYTTKDIPETFHEIISNNKSLIEGYLGDGFLFEAPLFFRTVSIPEEFANYDIYSNVWHQDSHDGDLLLKIFVLIKDVTLNDGPFIFLERKDTIKNWKELRERWSFSKFKSIPVFQEEKKVIGKKGDYLIINTANCMHRASIPQNDRDMVQLALYPKWRKNSDRNTYKFNNDVK